MSENETKKKEKKKILIDDLYNHECARFKSFIADTGFIALILMCLFFLFLKIELYPIVHNGKIIPEVIGVIGNIITISMIIAVAGLPDRFFGQVAVCCTFSYAINLLLVNYCNWSFFGPLFALGILCLCLYAVSKYARSMYLIGAPILLFLCTFIVWSIDNTIPPQIFKNASTTVAKDNEKRNIIFLVLSNHIGYDFGMENAKALDEYRLKDTKDKYAKTGKSSWAETFHKVIGGFYVSNGFSFFPHAFNYEGSGNDLIAAAVNFNENYVKDSGILIPDYSRNVYNNSPEKIAISRNNLFSSFHKNGYKIKVYQSKGANLCSDRVIGDIDTCYTYSNTGEMYKTSISNADKSMLLTDMWLSSYFKSVSVDKLLKKILFIRSPNDYPVVINEQFTVMDQLEKDVVKSDGKNLFFAYIRLPYRPFVYGANCSFLNTEEWRDNLYSSDNNKYLKYDFYQKYLGQLFCSYGKLEQMMSKFRKSGVLEHSMVIIFGDQGASLHDYKYAFDNKETDKYKKALNLLENMKSQYSTIMAYYDPKAKYFTNHNNGCDITTLLRRNLLKDKNTFCKTAPLNNGDEATEIANNLYTLWEERIKSSFDAITLVRDFKEWAQEWIDSQSQDKK